MGDSKVWFRDFKEERLINEAKIKNNRVNNIELLSIYNEYIKFISTIVKQLGIKDNSISYSYIISNMIEDGYLSDNGKFIRTDNSRELLDMLGFWGLDVVFGRGCCRHVSSIQKDIFKELNLLSKFLFSYYSSKITEKHVVNIINNDGAFYVHDLINKSYLRFSSFGELTPYVDFETQERLIYDIKTDCLFDVDSEMLEKFEFLVKIYTNGIKSMSFEELKDIIIETNNEYEKRNRLLNDFAYESKLYIKDIKKIKTH